MAGLTPDQVSVIRAEFGRAKGVTPDELRERAQQLDDAADEAATRAAADRMRERAIVLQEAAADLAAGDEKEHADQADDQAAADQGRAEKPPKTTRQSQSGGRSRRARGGKTRKIGSGKVGRAARQATIGEPTDYAARAIVGVGSWAWLVIVGTISAALVYRLVTNPGPTVRIAQQMESAVDRFIYPAVAFPERAAERARDAVQRSPIKAAKAAPPKRGQ